MKLTKEQTDTIEKLEKKGFKQDDKKSGFEKEFDGTYFYTFYAKDSMGVAMIQVEGKITDGNLAEHEWLPKTPQDKCLFIIKLFELSDRQVAQAIGSATKTANSKRKNDNYNKFLDEDYQNLKSHYLEKSEKIKHID